MKLTRISLDDWEGIYNEEGVLLDQGHRIQWSRVVEKLGHSVEDHYIENDNLDEFGNHLPDRLSEILGYIKKKK
jgi:hypothetical protein